MHQYILCPFLLSPSKNESSIFKLKVTHKKKNFSEIYQISKNRKSSKLDKAHSDVGELPKFAEVHKDHLTHAPKATLGIYLFFIRREMLRFSLVDFL